MGSILGEGRPVRPAIEVELKAEVSFQKKQESWDPVETKKEEVPNGSAERAQTGS